MEDNVGAYEEVNRQIGNVREDIKTLMEKQEEFQKSILQMLEGNSQAGMTSRKNSAKIYVESRLNINDTEEDVIIAKTR